MKEILYRLGVLIFKGISVLIEIMYQLFAAVASARLFKEDTILNFATRIHGILGVVMIFVVMTALFKMAVDPSKLVGSGKGSGKDIAMRLVTSLALLLTINVIFNFAYDFQNALISDNVIGKLFFGGYTATNPESADLNKTMADGGKKVAITILRAFYISAKLEKDSSLSSVGTEELPNANSMGTVFILDEPDIMDYNKRNNGLVNPKIVDFLNPDTGYVAKNGIDSLNDVTCDTIHELVTFKWILASLAGLLVVYVMFVYSIDLGVRVIKLSFYQLVAPIPIAMRAIPGKADTFDKWLKETISTFVDVFVRLAVVFFCVYAIQVVGDTTLSEFWSQTPNTPKPTELIQTFAQALIILGIILFMKSAPKLISSVLGTGGGGDLGFGLKKLKSNLGEGKKAIDKTRNAANRVGKTAAGAVAGAKQFSQNKYRATENLGQDKLNPRPLMNRAQRLAASAASGLIGAARGAKAGATSKGTYSSMFGDIAGNAGAAGQKTSGTVKKANELHRGYLGQSMRDMFSGRVSDPIKAGIAGAKKQYENAKNDATHTAQEVAKNLPKFKTATESAGLIGNTMNTPTVNQKTQQLDGLKGGQTQFANGKKANEEAEKAKKKLEGTQQGSAKVRKALDPSKLKLKSKRMTDANNALRDAKLAEEKALGGHKTAEDTFKKNNPGVDTTSSSAVNGAIKAKAGNVQKLSNELKKMTTAGAPTADIDKKKTELKTAEEDFAVAQSFASSQTAVSRAQEDVQKAQERQKMERTVSTQQQRNGMASQRATQATKKEEDAKAKLSKVSGVDANDVTSVSDFVQSAGKEVATLRGKIEETKRNNPSADTSQDEAKLRTTQENLQTAVDYQEAKKEVAASKSEVISQSNETNAVTNSAKGLIGARKAQETSVQIQRASQDAYVQEFPGADTDLSSVQSQITSLEADKAVARTPDEASKIQEKINKATAYEQSIKDVDATSSTYSSAKATMDSVVSAQDARIASSGPNLQTAKNDIIAPETEFSKAYANVDKNNKTAIQTEIVVGSSKVAMLAGRETELASTLATSFVDVNVPNSVQDFKTTESGKLATLVSQQAAAPQDKKADFQTDIETAESRIKTADEFLQVSKDKTTTTNNIKVATDYLAAKDVLEKATAENNSASASTDYDKYLDSESKVEVATAIFGQTKDTLIHRKADLNVEIPADVQKFQTKRETDLAGLKIQLVAAAANPLEQKKIQSEIDVAEIDIEAAKEYSTAQGSITTATVELETVQSKLLSGTGAGFLIKRSVEETLEEETQAAKIELQTVTDEHNLARISEGQITAELSMLEASGQKEAPRYFELISQQTEVKQIITNTESRIEHIGKDLNIVEEAKVIADNNLEFTTFESVQKQIDNRTSYFDQKIGEQKAIISSTSDDAGKYDSYQTRINDTQRSLDSVKATIVSENKSLLDNHIGIVKTQIKDINNPQLERDLLTLYNSDLPADKKLTSIDGIDYNNLLEKKKVVKNGAVVKMASMADILSDYLDKYKSMDATKNPKKKADK